MRNKYDFYTDYKGELDAFLTFVNNKKQLEAQKKAREDEIRRKAEEQERIKREEEEGLQDFANWLWSQNCFKSDAIPSTIEELRNVTELELVWKEGWLKSPEKPTYIPESIKYLRNLRMLIIRGFNLEPVDEGLFKLDLSSMEDGEVYEGCLRNPIPDSLCELDSLEALEIISSRLEELPESIGYIKKLKKLNLYGNELNYLPDSIGELEKLTYLNLSINNICELPESMGKLTKLVNLYIVQGTNAKIPKVVRKLPNLDTMSKIQIWNAIL